MTAFEYWQEQREGLRKTIAQQQDLDSVIYATKHAILQTEQNLLAAQTDEVLRQQLGVLFALLKNSMSLLSVPVNSTTWVAASRRQEKRASAGFPFMLAAVFAVLAAGLWAYSKGDLLGWALPLAAVVLAVVAWVILLREKKEAKAGPQDQVRVTFSVDAERLLGAIDAQITMIDRCTSDFTYLNQSLRTMSGGADRHSLEAVSELLEAIYAYDDELWGQAEESMGRLLAEMGLEIEDYSAENSRLFNQLPSKNVTRTLCPAILAAEDHRLLRRGTAVVKTDAA